MVQASPSSPQRQFVNFLFLKLDPAWRRLPESEREAGKSEFLEIASGFQSKFMVLAYSTFGIRAETDLMFWRISYSLEDFETMSSALQKTSLGAYLTTPYSFLSMTKRSLYVDKLNPDHPEKRFQIVPGQHTYLFVYPFVKTREWYLLPQETRQKMMDEHIRVGSRFPSVKLNTTYAFGLDDQEFVVAFETDFPNDFLDLVMALRETEGSRYTLRDTPIFTCIHKPLHEIIEVLCS